jgi:hypothetical protein
MNDRELQQKLAEFQGTKQIRYSPLLGADIVFTDGIEFIKDEYPWLIEKIIECQKSEDWALDNELQLPIK